MVVSPQPPPAISSPSAPGYSTNGLESADDRTIVGRAADGDTRAFEVLVRRYAGLMRVVARNVLGSNSDIDDVVQESFIVAWQRLETLQDPSVVKSWLLRIVTRRSLDRLRAGRGELPLDDSVRAMPSTQPSPESAAMSRSFEAAVATALASLSEDQRRCWVLRTVAEYSYSEIASELLLPESTVRGLLARARTRMSHELEEWR